MKPPRFLLAAALLFWGWQTGFLAAALIMALALEAPHWVELRWDLSNDDFSRVWVFCTLLFMAAAVYAFTANEGPADFRGLFQNPNFFTQRNAGTASARTAAALIRWLPMIFFFFLAAQEFSSREGIPLETISLILRRRWKKAIKSGRPVPPTRTVNVSYPYFALCLLGASAHSREDSLFFWGLCGLLAWALWAQRSPRFSPVLWAICLALAIALGYGGHRGIGYLQRYVENFNAQWLAGFSRRGFDPTRSRTALGQIGRVKASGKIVIRVTPKDGPAPPLLREASYRTYKSQTWYSGNAKSEMELINESTNRGTWILLSDKTNSACANIACYLERGKALLPLAEGSGRLEHLPAYVLHKNKGGAVLAEGPGLVVFDDCYGPGATIDSPPDDKDDVYVPPKEIPALEQAIAELEPMPQDPYKLKSISRFFQSKFSYSLWQEPDRFATNTSPLTRFLTRTRSGHCEYFATATVLLLRKLEIPARYAVGYAVHESSGNQYVVRQRDAHAWCLVWDEAHGLWRDFDTTPGSWMQAEANRASPFQWLADGWSRIVFEISKLRWGQSRLRQYFLWSLAPVLGVLLFQIIFRSGRRRRRSGAGEEVGVTWPGLDSEFYQLERRLSATGLGRPPDESLAQWLTRLQRQPALSGLGEPLENALRLHYRYRFDPLGLSAADRDLLRSDVQTCLAQLTV